MRCPEIVLAILNNPVRTDNYYSAAFNAFLDARRMLRKDVQRRADFIHSMHLYDATKKINGPMHGLVEYANALDIHFVSYHNEIIIETPLGHKMDICTPHITHFRHVITEACRHAAMKQLDRTSTEDQQESSEQHKKKKSKRGDMQGISAHVDIKATLALVDHKCKEKHESDGPTHCTCYPR